MTFISAFRAKDGIVLGADSQETYGDYKLTVDKLNPVQVGEYQLAIGGSGLGDLVDDLIEQVQEWVGEWRASSENEIIQLLRPRLRNFYSVDVAAYPDTDATQKRIHALLCLKHPNNPQPILLEIKATTVRRAKNCCLVGWDSDILQQFVRRLYRKEMPVSQGVLLTLYLFQIVGSANLYVGGETRIVIGGSNGIRIHEHLYVSKIQENIALFTKLIDQLILRCPDTSLTPAAFDALIKEFTDTAKHLREKYLNEFGHLAMLNALTNPTYVGDTYPLIPPGSVITIREDFTSTTEVNPERVQQMKDRIKEAEELSKKMKHAHGEGTT